MGTQIIQAVFTPNVSMTSNAFAQQAILASSIAQCAHLNNDLQTRYDMAVRDFNANMETGQKHDPPLVPPPAPKSWVVLAPDANGYQFYDQTGPALSPTPPLTVDTTDLGTLSVPVRDPNHISVGNRISGAWFQVGTGDGTPNGFVTPPNTKSADGVTGSFTKFGAPVGNGWYLLAA